MLSSTLKITYNAIGRWITGLPYNTRLTNLLTLTNLPPMEAYLDYLSLQYAIRLHFLPDHHALSRPHPEQTTRNNLPGLHHLYALSKHLVIGKFEDRMSTSTADGVPKIICPNPDKTISLQKLHKKWLRSLPDHTIVIYTDGSKLDSGATGCGWVIFNIGNHQLFRIKEGSCHLGNRAEVYDAELHAVQEATNALFTTTISHSPIFICINNQAAIDRLQFNKENHEYARHALCTLQQLLVTRESVHSLVSFFCLFCSSRSGVGFACVLRSRICTTRSGIGVFACDAPARPPSLSRCGIGRGGGGGWLFARSTGCSKKVLLPVEGWQEAWYS